MAPTVLLTYYCLLVLAASIVGGMIPLWFQLTHRWMEVAVSFVAGVMLGVGMLHLLPHAVAEAIAAAPGAPPEEAITRTLWWTLAGMLAMFFIERFLCYHHHEAPAELEAECDGDHHDHAHAERHVHTDHVHDITWTGATLGLVLHSVLAGVALAASTQHGSHDASLAGFGTFLVIILHKPFDSMTIGMLMARGGWNLPLRHIVNGLFSLAIPLGVAVFYLGLMPEESESTGAQQTFVAYALAFSAGTFLCISLSDLLPELQFHHHDRVKLSLALVAGLAVAAAALVIEDHTGHIHHGHDEPAAAAEAWPSRAASGACPVAATRWHTQSTTRQSIQRRSGSTPAWPM